MAHESLSYSREIARHRAMAASRDRSALGGDRGGRGFVLAAVDDDGHLSRDQLGQVVGGVHGDADAAVADRLRVDVEAAVDGDAADDVERVVHLAELAMVPARAAGEDGEVAAGGLGDALPARGAEGLAGAGRDGQDVRHCPGVVDHEEDLARQVHLDVGGAGLSRRRRGGAQHRVPLGPGQHAGRLAPLDLLEGDERVAPGGVPSTGRGARPVAELDEAALGGLDLDGRERRAGGARAAGGASRRSGGRSGRLSNQRRLEGRSPQSRRRHRRHRQRRPSSAASSVPCRHAPLLPAPAPVLLASAPVLRASSSACAFAAAASVSAVAAAASASGASSSSTSNAARSGMRARTTCSSTEWAPPPTAPRPSRVAVVRLVVLPSEAPPAVPWPSGRPSWRAAASAVHQRARLAGVAMSGGRSMAPVTSRRVPGRVGGRPRMAASSAGASSSESTRTSTTALASGGTTLPRRPPDTTPTLTEMPRAGSARAWRRWMTWESSSTALAPRSGSRPACAARPRTVTVNWPTPLRPVFSLPSGPSDGSSTNTRRTRRASRRTQRVDSPLPISSSELTNSSGTAGGSSRSSRRARSANSACTKPPFMS